MHATTQLPTFGLHLTPSTIRTGAQTHGPHPYCLSLIEQLLRSRPEQARNVSATCLLAADLGLDTDEWQAHVRHSLLRTLLREGSYDEAALPTAVGLARKLVAGGDVGSWLEVGEVARLGLEASDAGVGGVAVTCGASAENMAGLASFAVAHCDAAELAKLVGVLRKWDEATRAEKAKGDGAWGGGRIGSRGEEGGLRRGGKRGKSGEGGEGGKSGEGSKGAA